MQPFSASSASGASFAPTEIMQIKYPSSGYNVQTAWNLLYFYIPASLHGASAVLNPGGYMKGVLQPRQKRLPAGTCYIPSDLLHVRLPVSRVCLHPCHCVPSFRYAGERRETDPAVMKPHHNRRVCRSGAVCLRIIYLIYLSFQNYITYKMTSVCHVFLHQARSSTTSSRYGMHPTSEAL